ncbi:MAG: chemotaxis protein CheX [Roseburia sp.]
MYTQFFGNFLLSKGAISAEDLVNALHKQSTTYLKLGTLAIHAGLLTSSEVDAIVIMQTHQDKRFGELAIEGGYLTSEQVDQLLSSQKPDYLLLGQILIEDGLLTNAQFEDLLQEYQSSNEIYDLDTTHEQKDMVEKLINKFCDFESTTISEKAISYLSLLFNDIVRFIGKDFTPLNPVLKSEYLCNYCVTQEINGPLTINSGIDMSKATAIGFASRYAKEDFTEFDEYVKASLEDFLNLHNGLFNVNMSNEFSLELNLCPPVVHEDITLKHDSKTYVFPVIFPFGTVNFLLVF